MPLIVQVRAHPRSRGENDLDETEKRRAEGSSPLTRGKLKRIAFNKHIPRLIPAHAGKTLTALEYLGPLGAHPRSRGENEQHVINRFARFGSSPLTRGKLALVQVNGAGKRLIPAHAGKT